MWAGFTSSGRHQVELPALNAGWLWNQTPALFLKLTQGGGSKHSSGPAWPQNKRHLSLQNLCPLHEGIRTGSSRFPTLFLQVRVLG